MDEDGFVSNKSEAWVIFKNYISLIDSEGKEFLDIYGTDSRINLAAQLTQAHVTMKLYESLKNKDVN